MESLVTFDIRNISLGDNMLEKVSGKSYKSIHKSSSQQGLENLIILDMLVLDFSFYTYYLPMFKYNNDAKNVL